MGKDRPLRTDPQGGDQRVVLGREVSDAKPTFVAAASVRDDEPFLFQRLQVVSDGTEREAEPPRELPQMKTWLRDDQGEDALT
jgi:hypothetical protein